MQGYRYFAFISYSHHDGAWVDGLQRALETYAVPSRLVGLKTEAGVIPARLAPIFRDRDELPSATDLSREVNDVLAQAGCLIVVCSPHAAQSHWVDQEVRAFQRLGRAHRIFCVIIAGEPGASAWAGREHDECFVPALRQRFDAAGAATGERLDPVAADARPHRDGKANVRLKLIAGMLGIDLDDLRHRERRRQRWRMAALVAGALALLALTSTLALNAMIARQAAERRQKQAEDLVGYMLGDLDDKLRQVNRLDILESVADKAVKYFAALPVADMTDDALAQRARALLKLGAVRFDQGLVPEAQQAFAAAQVTSTELVRRIPGRTDYVWVNAESMSWLGRVSWTRGDLDVALTRFRAERDVLAGLGQAQLEEISIMDQSASLNTNIGRILEARGELEAARNEYVAVLQIYEHLSAREPDKLKWKSEIGYAHNNIGQLAWIEGNLGEAIREYAADRQTKSSLLALDPSNNLFREDLLISNAILGKSLLAVGETASAAHYLRIALVDAEKLLALDPTVTSWQEDAAYYGVMLAALARMQGDITEASHIGEASLARLRSLASQDPDNVAWVRELSEGETEAARRSLAQRRMVQARQYSKAALERAEKLLKTNDFNQVIGRAFVLASITSGDIAASENDMERANSDWKSAEAIAEKFSASSNEPLWLDARTVLRLKLGGPAQAMPLVEKLAHMGYRHPDFAGVMNEYGAAIVPDAETLAKIASAVATIRD